jgi:endonuclease G, mitochondrial
MFFRILFPVILSIHLWFLFINPASDMYQNKPDNNLRNFNKNFVPLFEDGQEIIVHKAFTLSYNEKFEQANWVAYLLTAEMCDNNGEERTNNFRIDPDVKSGSATPDDYKKSGYDRGHLCPAGDMGWNEQTMSESFFMSNMSPQLPAFNRGIWKKLETNVRDWAKKEKEIYIVTAAVLRDSLPTIGINKVAVPEFYYKVILDVHAPDYKAIAFLLPNKGSTDPVFDYVVSIDSVEHLTGIDFFPALTDSLENVLESRSDPALWQ